MCAAGVTTCAGARTWTRVLYGAFVIIKRQKYDRIYTVANGTKSIRIARRNARPRECTRHYCALRYTTEDVTCVRRTKQYRIVARANGRSHRKSSREPRAWRGTGRDTGKIGMRAALAREPPRKRACSRTFAGPALHEPFVQLRGRSCGRRAACPLSGRPQLGPLVVRVGRFCILVRLLVDHGGPRCASSRA